MYKLANVVDEDRSPILATAERPQYCVRRYLPYFTNSSLIALPFSSYRHYHSDHVTRLQIVTRYASNAMVETPAWKQQTLVIWYGCAGAAVYRIINCHSRIFAVHGMVMEDSGFRARGRPFPTLIHTSWYPPTVLRAIEQPSKATTSLLSQVINNAIKLCLRIQLGVDLEAKYIMVDMTLFLPFIDIFVLITATQKLAYVMERFFALNNRRDNQ
ncbi:hypothetical protein BC629DRAFT_1440033 [Irpex lacteus]|nr:hypothetical protein BC629DRAFT_1440033 [Irpex lacteus]